MSVIEIWIYSMGSAIAVALISLLGVIGLLLREEFQMTLTLNAFLPDIYVSSVQYAIRLKAPTLGGVFDPIAPTLFAEFQALRISGTLTYLGNRCELPES